MWSLRSARGQPPACRCRCTCTTSRTGRARMTIRWRSCYGNRGPACPGSGCGSGRRRCTTSTATRCGSSAATGTTRSLSCGRCTRPACGRTQTARRGTSAAARTAWRVFRRQTWCGSVRSTRPAPRAASPRWSRCGRRWRTSGRPERQRARSGLGVPVRRLRCGTRRTFRSRRRTGYAIRWMRCIRAAATPGRCSSSRRGWRLARSSCRPRRRSTSRRGS